MRIYSKTPNYLTFGNSSIMFQNSRILIFSKNYEFFNVLENKIGTKLTRKQNNWNKNYV